MIAVLTEVPRLYYLFARELKRRKLEFYSLTFADAIPEKVRVVLTSEEEAARVNFPCVVAATEKSAVIAVEKAHSLAKGLREHYSQLVVGIDPGEKPGLAVLGDGKVVHAAQLASPEEVSSSLEDLLRIYSCDSLVIKVGNGGGVFRQRLLRVLQKRFSFPIELVDEHATTPSLGRGDFSREVRDIIAAINIAMKQGRRLRKKVEVRPTPGEIKNIQKHSRQRSGSITISRALAERVARGELTMERAIELHLRSLRS